MLAFVGGGIGLGVGPHHAILILLDLPPLAEGQQHLFDLLLEVVDVGVGHDDLHHIALRLNWVSGRALWQRNGLQSAACEAPHYEYLSVNLYTYKMMAYA